MNPMRTHPLRRMILAGAATVTVLVALLGLKPDAALVAAPPPAATSAPAVPGSSGSGSSGSGSSGSGSSGSGSSASGSSGSGSSAQTVKGDVVDTRYGQVQVEVKVSGSQILAVDAIRTPDGNGRDRAIASYAVPVLERAVLAAQSANVDTVSGATYTSEGYLQSLQSALDQVHG